MRNSKKTLPLLLASLTLSSVSINSYSAFAMKRARPDTFAERPVKRRRISETIDLNKKITKISEECIDIFNAVKNDTPLKTIMKIETLKEINRKIYEILGINPSNVERAYIEYLPKKILTLNTATKEKLSAAHRKNAIALYYFVNKTRNIEQTETVKKIYRLIGSIKMGLNLILDPYCYDRNIYFSE